MTPPAILPIAPATRRPLRIFPFDPMVDRFGRSAMADVPYERLDFPGPSGRLVEVIDYDGVRDCYYPPVNLDDPDILRNQGLDTIESDPRFHQQMVYAVVMRVLESFERGLGRPFRWRGTRRLRVFPHAFEGRNAYFDEDLFALLFGTFTADEDEPGANIPGQRVFTCLSHDIIAHECTHAVIKRLRPHYSTPTNPDVLAFHEGFADIVALLQHFTYPDIVAEHVASTRSSLSSSNSLVTLASQFGMASGTGQPLRSAVTAPTTGDYGATEEEHDRGAVLCAAVLGGFLRSYAESIADLVRLATSGSGVLQPGALHPDLVRRIADTACTTALRVSDICIRAFDYLPPVDVTFDDYLRALVTADHDMRTVDKDHLRANLIEEFRIRGIYPQHVASLSDLSLRLEPVESGRFPKALPFVPERLIESARELDRQRRTMRSSEQPDDDGPPRPTAHADGGASDWAAPDQQRTWAKALHAWATEHQEALQLDPSAPIQVAGFHTSLRLDADGYAQTHISLQLVQRDADSERDLGGITPLGGTTVIADGSGRVRYVIAKPLPTEANGRLEQLNAFAAGVEHRLRRPAWAADARTRIVNNLNLRSIDGRR